MFLQSLRGAPAALLLPRPVSCVIINLCVCLLTLPPAPASIYIQQQATRLEINQDVCLHCPVSYISVIVTAAC